MKNYEGTIIGTTAYLKDNSYSFTVGTNKNPHLAGTLSGKSAKKVTIISEPYKLTCKNSGTKSYSEFVTVKYGDDLHVVLNRFIDKPDEFPAEVIIEKIRELINMIKVNR